VKNDQPVKKGQGQPTRFVRLSNQLNLEKPAENFTENWNRIAEASKQKLNLPLLIV
jgi:hypothetical protein